jgi:hypothetical protein
MRTTRVALGIIVAGGLLGIWADALFYGQPLGLNVLLWTAAFVAALAALFRIARAPLNQGRRWKLAPLLVFALAFLWRDSRLLMAANLVAIAGAVTIGGLRRNGMAVRFAPVTEYVLGMLAAGFSAAAGAVHLIHSDVGWADVRESWRPERITPAARGIALGRR